MSEFRSNPRLDNFDANKAAQEQLQFEKALYGNAGHLDPTNRNATYSDQARRRVEEADTYERHLEAMAERGDSDPSLADLNGQASAAYEREQDEAIAENGAFDAQRAAEEQAINEKMANDPEVRRMQMMANDIAELRNRTFDHTNADALVDRLKNKEDRLNELLEKYSERADADPIVIDRIIDSTVTPVETSASTSTTTETTTTAERRAEVDTAWADDTEEGERDVAEGEARGHDEAAAEAVAEHEEAEEHEAHEHVIDTSNRPDIDTSWANEDEERGEAAVVETDEQHDVDTAWANEDHHDDEGLDIVDGHDDEEDGERPRNQFTWRQPLWRVHEIFTNTRNRVLDRRDAREAEGKRGNRKMVIIAAGAMAVAGAIAAWRLGVFDHAAGHHGSTGANPGHGGHGGAGGNGGNGGTGGNGGNTPPATPEFPQAAYDVHNGEGWYETFQDMNIPHDEWADVLQKAGPQLHEHGWAYVMDNGQWGISQPGTLPKEALELIKNTADQVAASR